MESSASAERMRFTPAGVVGPACAGMRAAVRIVAETPANQRTRIRFVMIPKLRRRARHASGRAGAEVSEFHAVRRVGMEIFTPPRPDHIPPENLTDAQLAEAVGSLQRKLRSVRLSLRGARTMGLVSLAVILAVGFV